MTYMINPYKYAQSSSAFDPTTIAGLALWHDATDASTISKTGSSVTRWDDKSGGAGGDATQASASLQLQDGVRTINGLNALEGNGSRKMVADFGLFPGSQDFTMFFMAALDVGDTSQFGFAEQTSGSDAFFLNASPTANIISGRAGNSSISGAWTSDTDPHVFSIRRSGSSNTQIRVDGNLIVQGSTGFRSGASVQELGRVNGALLAICVYDSPLSVADQNTFGQGYADLMGITWNDIT